VLTAPNRRASDAPTQGELALARRCASAPADTANARAEHHSAAVVARQRTELGVDGDGHPVSPTVVSVDGPAATTRRGPVVTWPLPLGWIPPPPSCDVPGRSGRAVVGWAVDEA
jgi:hypothetical protein